MTDSMSFAIVMVLGLGVVAQWVAWRFKIPALVLLSVIGIVVGPVLGVLQPAAVFGEALQPIIALCVAIILFEGGLNLRRAEFKASGQVVRRLTTVGVVVALLLGTLAAHYIGQLSWQVAWVFGAITVVTGPTVIGPMLRQAKLEKHSATYLKWEGIINDPIGVLIAVLLFQYFVYSGETASLTTTLFKLLYAIGVSLLLGVLTGFGLGTMFRKGLVPEYLKSPIIIGAILLIFTLANQVQHEAGLLAVTIMGIVMGNMKLPSIEELRRFKEYITIILVSSVFILLTANLQPGALALLNWHSLALLLAMLFVVRPLSVWLSTIKTDASHQQRFLTGWIAPRGIVAAATAGIFSPALVAEGYADAEQLLPLVFALIFITVTLHSFTVTPLARWLSLQVGRNKQLLLVGASPWNIKLAKALEELGLDSMIADPSWRLLKNARHQGLNTYCGEVLSEAAIESDALSGVEQLFANTNNDAYNALVCQHYAHELGRQNVFQLSMLDEDDRHEPHHVMTGIEILSDIDHETLSAHLHDGWGFKRTPLTEQYTYQDAIKALPEGAIPFAFVTAKKQLQFIADNTPVPGDGTVLISFALDGR